MNAQESRHSESDSRAVCTCDWMEGDEGIHSDVLTSSPNKRRSRNDKKLSSTGNYPISESSEVHHFVKRLVEITPSSFKKSEKFLIPFHHVSSQIYTSLSIDNLGEFCGVTHSDNLLVTT